MNTTDYPTLHKHENLSKGTVLFSCCSTFHMYIFVHQNVKLSLKINGVFKVRNWNTLFWLDKKSNATPIFWQYHNQLSKKKFLPRHFCDEHRCVLYTRFELQSVMVRFMISGCVLYMYTVLVYIMLGCTCTIYVNWKQKSCTFEIVYKMCESTVILWWNYVKLYLDIKLVHFIKFFIRCLVYFQFKLFSSSFFFIVPLHFITIKSNEHVFKFSFLFITLLADLVDSKYLHI